MGAPFEALRLDCLLAFAAHVGTVLVVTRRLGLHRKYDSDGKEMKAFNIAA